MQKSSTYLKHIFQIYLKSLCCRGLLCVCGLGLASYFTIYLHPGLIALNSTECVTYGPTLSQFVGPLGWNSI